VPARGRRDSRDRQAMLPAAESARRSTVRVAFGFAIPLLVTALFFAAYGALDDMLYATLFFNASLPVHAARRIGGAVAFAAVAPLAFRRANVAVWYGLVVLCFWAGLSPRGFLSLGPFGPVAPALAGMSRWAPFGVLC